MLYESSPDGRDPVEITNSDECKANALLISKAPEMLEMLELMTTYYTADNIEKAKQLIKEATNV